MRRGCSSEGLSPGSPRTRSEPDLGGGDVGLVREGVMVVFAVRRPKRGPTPVVATDKKWNR